MIYQVNFLHILKSISKKFNNKISETILSTYLNRDVDIVPYIIDVSIEKEGMINFIPKKQGEQLKYKRLDCLNWLGSGHNNLVMEMFPDVNLNHNMSLRDKFNVLKVATSRSYNDLIFFLVDNGSGDNGIVYCNKYVTGFELEIGDIKFQEMKIGRFVNQLLRGINVSFKDKDIEEFVNIYISAMRIFTSPETTLSLVEGNSIAEWYDLSKYYNDEGNLGKSCMRFTNCSPFFKIYTENKDKCKMLIMVEDNKLIGRALIWTLDSGDLYMDRVYTNSDAYKGVFTQYALNNDIKYFNGYTNGRNDREVVIENNKNGLVDFKVTLENHKYDKYPYMDSFRFLKDGVLQMNNSATSDYIDMTSTTGNPYRY